MSDIIDGPSRRYWIVKVVDKRVNQDVKFEDVEKAIVDGLQAKKSLDMRDAADKELRAKAVIKYFKPTSAASIVEE